MTMPIRSFRDLVAWQEGMALVRDAYAVIRAVVPEERYALGVQMRRAAVSVVANIAEGHSRPSTSDSRNDYRRFVGIALGSLGELESHLLVAREQSLAPDAAVNAALQRIPGLRRLLLALHKSLEGRIELG